MSGPENQSNPLETELKQRKTRDPHIAYMQTVAGILSNPMHPGLSVLHLKGLVERVFTSGELFEAGRPEVRLDLQPIMITLSDSMRHVTGFDIVVLGERFYSLQGLSQQLSIAPSTLNAAILGKTFDQLPPQLQAIILQANDPRYESTVRTHAINLQVSRMQGKIEKPKDGETVTISDVDITTISTRHPDRGLTDVERLYLETLATVVSSTQVTSSGKTFPIGLSETYLRELWAKIQELRPDYTPRVDFNPVAAAFSPVFEITTGRSLRPLMQLYDREIVNNIIGQEIPRTSTLIDAPNVVTELLGEYDNSITEQAITDAIADLQ